MRHPQIAQTGLSAAGIQISDRRFINLDIRAFHHLVFNLPVDGLQPLTGYLNPSAMLWRGSQT
jgi:hypothetical protein